MDKKITEHPAYPWIPLGLALVMLFGNWIYGTTDGSVNITREIRDQLNALQYVPAMQFTGSELSFSYAGQPMTTTQVLSLLRYYASLNADLASSTKKEIEGLRQQITK